MIRKMSAFFLLITVALIATSIYAEDIMDKLIDGYEITIVTPGTIAPLCPRPKGESFSMRYRSEAT